ncbi:hypothetical protein J8273_3669 [Carpediemonas membranifera]|uniref:Uncharacterized protein n=1 Tax=Carpediemonas membranifera TaxID=201153 RepID=A0A8J6B844_9EUKA|nr:hypothetical protein J8273_3669 [Carpediemonas membranifera]|eukprot:KAG9394697.1 hypothetical protein J8273_3669 [Carpediemonas membranifera]
MQSQWIEGMEILKQVSMTIPEYDGPSIDELELEEDCFENATPPSDSDSEEQDEDTISDISQESINRFFARYSINMGTTPAMGGVLPLEAPLSPADSDSVADSEARPESPVTGFRERLATKQVLMDECHADYASVLGELDRLAGLNEALTIELDEYRQRYGHVNIQDGATEDDIAARLYQGRRTCLCHITGVTAARDLLITVTRLGVGPALTYAVLKIRKVLNRRVFEDLMREDADWAATANMILRYYCEPTIPTTDTALDTLDELERQVRMGYASGDLEERLCACAQLAGRCRFTKAAAQSFMLWEKTIETASDLYASEGKLLVPAKIPPVSLIEKAAQHSLAGDPTWPDRLSAVTLRAEFNLSQSVWEWLWIRVSCEAATEQWDRVFDGFKRGKRVGTQGTRVLDVYKSKLDSSHVVAYLLAHNAPDKTIKVFLSRLTGEAKLRVMTQVDVMIERPCLAFKTVQHIRGNNRPLAIEFFQVGMRAVRRRAKVEPTIKNQDALTLLEGLLAVQPL